MAPLPLIPAALFAIAGVALLTLRKRPAAARARGIAWIALGAAVLILLAQGGPSASASGRSGMTIDDGLTRAQEWIAILFGAFGIATASEEDSSRGASRMGLFLLALGGVFLASSANHLVALILAMQLAAWPGLYLPPQLQRRQENRTARGLAVASLALLIVGCVLLWTAMGSLFFSHLHLGVIPATTARHHTPLPSPIPVALGWVCVFAGLGVHFLVAPFQLAVGELLEAADDDWKAGFLVVFPRAAALFLMTRVTLQAIPRHDATPQTVLTAIAILSLLIGGALVLVQDRLRRLVGFTVMAQGGWTCASLAAGRAELGHPAATPWLSAAIPGGVAAALLSFVFDSLAIVGVLVLAGRGSQDDQDTSLERLPLLVGKSTMTGAPFCLLCISLAGLPPMPGFATRLAVLRSLLSVPLPAEGGFLPHQNVAYVFLALVGGGALVCLGFVYLALVRRVVREFALNNSRVGATLPVNPVRGGLMTATAAALLVMGIWPWPVLRVAARMMVAETLAEHLPRSSARRPPPTVDEEEAKPKRSAK